MIKENIDEDNTIDFITCSKCGNMYLIDIAIKMGYDDLIDTECHHCRHYDGLIPDKEFDKLIRLET